jgi:ABC-type cobalamin transport system permease subunit
MANTTEHRTENRPLPELIGGLASDISMLFRKEIELAKAEASEKLSQALTGVEMLLIGAVLALGALGVILAAAVSALAALLVAQGMGPTAANSVSALIVAVIVAIIAWVFIARGRNALRADKLSLDRTAHSLSRSAAAVKEKF